MTAQIRTQAGQMEECDNGGKCVGGGNDGDVCTSHAQCAGGGVCVGLAECVNVEAGFECVCQMGYAGDGRFDAGGRGTG